MTVGPGGSCDIDVDGVQDGNGSVSYRGLHDLVRDCSKLQTLYPNVPKHNVFTEVSRSVGVGRGLSPRTPNVMRVSQGENMDTAWGIADSGVSRVAGRDDSWGEVGVGIVNRGREHDLMLPAGE